ncbi:MAG: glycosyltransferase [Deltaproteobacteria bacterium]|nr:glycosyltransferase [Deltaproteobacteria bacterium]
MPTPPTLTRLVPPVVPAYGLSPVRAANDALMTRAVRSAMVERGIERPLVLTTIPTMAGVLGSLGERASIYLRMDDFSLWPGYDHAAIAEREAKLISTADAVLAPSEELLRGLNPSRSGLSRHGVDVEHFAAPGPGGDPLDGVPHPRALVAGRLDERLDADVLTACLDVPGLHLVLLGEPVAIAPELLAHRRVHVRPPVAYADLPRWLHAADVLLVPYADSPLGHSLAPLKTRELIATGRPVLATPLRGTAGDPEVTPLLQLANSRQTPDALRRALDEPASARRARTEATRSMTWSSRARALEAFVARILGEGANGPRPV